MGLCEIQVFGKELAKLSSKFQFQIFEAQFRISSLEKDIPSVLLAPLP